MSSRSRRPRPCAKSPPSSHVYPWAQPSGDAPQPQPRRPLFYGFRIPARRRRLPGDGAADRLVEHGARSLTSEDLLRLVLGPGSAQTARRMLEDAGGLARLSQNPLGQLARLPGLSRARMVRLAAALELGRRGAWVSDGRAPCFRNPAEVARYLISRYGNRDVEEFGMLMLDSRGCLLRAEIISRGSLTETLVHPRELFRPAAAWQAASLILFHNHPSGNPEPSEADRQLTDRLRQAGAIMGIPVLDHVVIGAGDWHSFGEAGEI